MPRMTADLLLAPSAINPLKDRELDLRGYKIPAIENLAVTKDSLDSLDLTDNSIRSLSNLPRLPRLKHLLLANNPVSSISPSLPTSLPNLQSLVLTSSALDSLSPTLPLLGRLPRLEFLSLAGTPMSKRKWYREWAVHCCKRVRILDYTKVTMQEHIGALSLFVDTAAAAPTALAITLSAPDTTGPAGAQETTEAATFVPGEALIAPAGQPGRQLTDEEKARVKKAIEDAETVDEVRRLQRMLEQGFVPKSKSVAAPTPAPAPAPIPAATAEVEKEDEDEAMQLAEPKGKWKGKAAEARGGKAAKGKARGGAKPNRGRGKKEQEEETMEVEEEDDK